MFPACFKALCTSLLSDLILCLNVHVSIFESGFLFRLSIPSMNVQILVDLVPVLLLRTLLVFAAVYFNRIC